ncbi:hypothetical protein DACRYDRAFT_19840 [Dacryopinax primogenitus]|uniref:Metallo-beta-lactamase domain-containing protein n=1 Tax=Dacryopinax primogenitus (strain DJM 731) TaxID=1858805 RepID=M5GEC4_DACPD|nr:uncharacterized protein DACRYDRAFT_19840 [Dacryopinax primogenitus]EJU05287.1 hypothetical protein DACRYDRAFT_19840 [Dacryopinax primogenitus]
MRTELIFHGTGASSCLPNISCLTLPPEEYDDDEEGRCEACHQGANPWDHAEPKEALKNRRRNTGAVLRVTQDDGSQVTIVIDAGKSFVAAALEWFPKHGLRKIDAVVLSHAHADAMNGLDDLRCWTLDGTMQDHVDIYLSQKTFDEVERTFPYLVNKGMATGGGSVPEFQWNIISEFVEFDVQGVNITPLPVHHGRYFSPVIENPFPMTPPLSPPLSRSSSTQTFPFPSQALSSSPTPPVVFTSGYFPRSRPPSPVIPQPYIAFAFLLPNILYISDVSLIPPSLFSHLASLPEETKPRVSVLDCLRPENHTSHFGITEAVRAAHELGTEKNYLTGFMCGGQGKWISHRGWLRVCERVSDEKELEDFTEWTGSEGERRRCERAIEMGRKGIEEGKERAWIRPAFDGMRVVIDEHGRVSDGTYD